MRWMHLWRAYKYFLSRRLKQSQLCHVWPIFTGVLKFQCWRKSSRDILPEDEMLDFFLRTLREKIFRFRRRPSDVSITVPQFRRSWKTEVSMWAKLFRADNYYEQNPYSCPPPVPSFADVAPNCYSNCSLDLFSISYSYIADILYSRLSSVFLLHLYNFFVFVHFHYIFSWYSFAIVANSITLFSGQTVSHCVCFVTV